MLPIFRNDWGVLRPPALGSWNPELSVSVIIPTRGGHAGLDGVLAALSAQTYPSDLLEVVVVDAAPRKGRPPLRPAGDRPPNCRVVATPRPGGASHARAYGADISSGAILCWLDADMIVNSRHIEAHARWQHHHPEAVTIGRIRTSTTLPPDGTDIAGAARSGDLPRLLGGSPTHPRVEGILRRTRDLRRADHLGFEAYVGAATALPRWLYEEAGGLDPALTAGQGTEFGYRLWQVGAVFVSERRATAWHVAFASATHHARARPPSTRIRVRTLADAMPQPRSFRAEHRGRHRVPLIRACVDATGERFDVVRSCVDRLLGCAESDLAVTLVAPWAGADGDAGAGTEAMLEPRLLQAHYLGDPRVTFATAAPSSGFPSPYLLEVPASCGVGHSTVGRLLATADRGRAGVVELLPPSYHPLRPVGTEPGDAPPAGSARVRLWRTRALARASRVRRPGESRTEAVARVHGQYRIEASATDLTDLSSLPAGEVSAPPEPAATAFPPPPRLQWPPPGPLRRVLRTLRGWLEAGHQ